MLVIAVMYPLAEGQHFDDKYYFQSHMPMVRRLWEPLGLRETHVMRGRTAPDGTAPTYGVMTLLHFASMEAFDTAAGKHGAEIFADIPKFTNGTPVLQFNDTVD